MTQPIYMVIGCPASGKSWVCEQLASVFNYVRHDDYTSASEAAYVKAIVANAKVSTKPLLIETPFSVSQIKDPLEKQGLRVVPVFIQEPHDVLKQRYLARMGTDIPAGHLTRQETYAKRATEWQSFRGTSVEVLAHLKNAAPRQKFPWE